MPEVEWALGNTTKIRLLQQGGIRSGFPLAARSVGSRGFTGGDGVRRGRSSVNLRDLAYPTSRYSDGNGPSSVGR